MVYQVTLTELADATAARKHEHTRAADLGETIGEGFRALFDYAEHVGAQPAGPPQLAYLGDFSPEGEIDLDVYLPVAGSAPPADGVEVVALPGGPVAQTFHRGRYEDIGAAYAAIFQWIQETGHQQQGDPREIYLTGPDSNVAPEDYLTEVVVPLTRG